MNPAVLEPPVLSLAIPCYNEEAVLDVFLERVRGVLEPMGVSYELVFVNDGSRDATLAMLLKARDGDDRIKVIDLSRNFGKEAALTAAIVNSSGEAVIPIDADLQEPPELIPQMVAKWREGYEMVTARRSSRNTDTFKKRFTAQSFYKVFNKISETQLPFDTGDYRLMDRKVVDAFERMPECNRFMKGIFAWLGFKQAEVTFERDERAAGESKFTFWKLLRFALRSIFAFSSAPLKVWFYLGLFFSTCSFGYGSFLIIRTLIFGADVAGYASIMVVTLFLGGIQLIGLGVLGQYMGYIYNEVKRRPLYLVREIYGVCGKK
tara:strand:+ start:114 stop:1073 length:960 start_codon:yes stop_codon:yes gene_type:complete